MRAEDRGGIIIAKEINQWAQGQRKLSRPIWPTMLFILPAEDLTDYFYSFTQSCNYHTVHVSILMLRDHFFQVAKCRPTEDFQDLDARH